MEPFHEYLSLAKTVLFQKTDDGALLEKIAPLPCLDEQGISTLSFEAEKAAFTLPKLGWLISHIARLALESQTDDIWLNSLAYWYEARAANQWAKPLFAENAAIKAKRGFLQIGKKDWAAASDWLYYDLPRFKGNPNNIVQELLQAQAILDGSDLQKIAADCRLALASAQITQFKMDAAYENICLSQNFFEQTKNEYGIHRSQYVMAEYFRLKFNYEDSISTSKQAYKYFKEHQQIPQAAHCLRQMGTCLLYGTTKMDEALENFLAADKSYQQCDLELFHALCLLMQGITRLQKGDLETVETSFKEASKIFSRNHAYQLLADNFTTNGLLWLSKGQPQKAIRCFSDSKKYHHKLEIESETINDNLNLGKAYRLAGRYQDALLTLEEARERSIEANIIIDIAYAESQIAFVWYALKEFNRSLAHIDQAIILYQEQKQNATLITMNNLRARIFIDQKEYEKAYTCLVDSFNRSQEYSLPPQASIAKRLIGTLLIKMKEYDKAYVLLKESEKEFLEMEMMIDVANCKYSLAELFFVQDDLQNAEAYYQEALQICEGTYDEIDWRAKAGLAKVFQAYRHPEKSLEYYTQSISSLQNIRENFWQSSLAGSYSLETSCLFTEAISTAFSLGNHPEVFRFIETSKATSLIEQFRLKASPSREKDSSELENIKDEISWLREKLTINSAQNALQLATRNKQIRQELICKSKKYEELNSRIERRRFSRNPFLGNQRTGFEEIQNVLQINLGESWLALDFYYSEKNIFLCSISPAKIETHSIALTPRIQQAIENISQCQAKGGTPEESDLQVLGKALFPPYVLERLEPNTRLIISPHSYLHGLPYNALLPDQSGEHLVQRCTPTIIHSLRTAALLFKSNKPDLSAPRHKGLAVGLTTFNGLYPELPFIKQELESLGSMLTGDSVVLAEEKASWSNLVKLSQEISSAGLSGFSFLHIASHFFSDSVSGNLSGLSLYGEEVYQSQLRSLAPLPELVTLSGCNSLFSFHYAGDEPVGLPATCLVSGAKNIIGSFQPVKDETTARFMPEFYKHYFADLSPAFALARVQREFIANSYDLSSWIGYLCVGIG